MKFPDETAQRAAEELEALLEKKKKEAMNYFTAAHYDEVKKLEEEKANALHADWVASVLAPGLSKDIGSARTDAFVLLAGLEAAFRRMDEFFTLSESEREEVEEGLGELGLKTEQFTLLSMCASGDDMETLCDVFGKRKDSPDEQVLKDIRTRSVETATRAVREYRNNSPAEFAKILAAGLERCVKSFGNESLPVEKAMEWSGLCSDILYLLDSRPELVKASALTEHQIKGARAMAEMSRDIKIGLQAVEVLSAVALDRTAVLSKEQTSALIDSAVKMKAAIYDRSRFVKAWDEPVKTAAPVKMMTFN